MSHISFYPGPSRVNAKVTEYFYDAYMEGILSENHRSAAFMKLFKKTKKLLKQKLDVPEDYEIIFTSSATECWEIIAQSLTAKASFHVYNGAFGNKWCEYAGKLGVETHAASFDIEDSIPIKLLAVPDEADVVCVTQNETSNGTQVSDVELTILRRQFADRLIAVDATSSMAATTLPFKMADVWFASVQKGFGLPSGMGIMILSPTAVAKAEKLNENDHYNSLLFSIANSRKDQTPYTPNILGIYLLYRLMEDRRPIEEINRKVKNRFLDWMDFLNKFDSWTPLVENESVRSTTVIPLKAEPSVIKELLEKSSDAGFTLGSGYGEWKEDTIRIANFPSIKKKEIQSLRFFLKKNFD
ncbi:MAG: aminotransferase class V-fold PLP-dependent enzyme [Imperialibacter sp.]|uniref:aminotransferase class V-fold PLP-dependent enzyme n=1 Tax=Imperialibacter sp. TaxID=2038411 RepID=UPI0032EE0F43